MPAITLTCKGSDLFIESFSSRERYLGDRIGAASPEARADAFVEFEHAVNRRNRDIIARRRRLLSFGLVQAEDSLDHPLGNSSDAPWRTIYRSRQITCVDADCSKGWDYVVMSETHAHRDAGTRIGRFLVGFSALKQKITYA
jgi:hypothetical protein